MLRGTMTISPGTADAKMHQTKIARAKRINIDLNRQPGSPGALKKKDHENQAHIPRNTSRGRLEAHKKHTGLQTSMLIHRSDSI